MVFPYQRELSKKKQNQILEFNVREKLPIYYPDLSPLCFSMKWYKHYQNVRNWKKQKLK